MTHNDSQWLTIFTLWHTMTQNWVNFFANFYFLKFCSKKLFCLKWNSTQSGIQGGCFWLQQLFSAYLFPKTSTSFVWYENSYKEVFRGADFKLENCFLWSRNFKVLCLKWISVQSGIQGWWFWVQEQYFQTPSLKYLIYLRQNFKVLCLECHSVQRGIQGVHILNSTIVSSNSVPKIPFFGPKFQSALLRM